MLSTMLALKTFMALTVCVMLCNSTCYVEEQYTTPMKAYNITKNVESYRMCILYCDVDPKCVSASYSETQRVCHLQVPTDILICAVAPFRRFVKTDQGCLGQAPGVTYNRTSLSRDHGLDPCVPPALLHLENPPSLNLAPPVCAVRRLADGSAIYLRGLDGNGKYTSFGINPSVKMSKHQGSNTFRVDYTTDIRNYPFSFYSAFCAEENPDDNCCTPLPPYTATAITGSIAPVPTQIGACSGKTLYATLYLYANPFTFNGNDVKLFCAGGFWLAGDLNHGADGDTYRLATGSCGN